MKNYPTFLDSPITPLLFIIGLVLFVLVLVNQTGGKESRRTTVLEPSPLASEKPNRKDTLIACDLGKCGTKELTTHACTEAHCCQIGRTYVVTENREACQNAQYESIRMQDSKAVNGGSVFTENSRTKYEETTFPIDDRSAPSVQEKCQSEMAEYSICISEYNSKMAEYNACVARYTEQGVGNASYICSKPTNSCRRPFGC